MASVICKDIIGTENCFIAKEQSINVGWTWTCIFFVSVLSHNENPNTERGSGMQGSSSHNEWRPEADPSQTKWEVQKWYTKGEMGLIWQKPCSILLQPVPPWPTPVRELLLSSSLSKSASDTHSTVFILVSLIPPSLVRNERESKYYRAQVQRNVFLLPFLPLKPKYLIEQ